MFSQNSTLKYVTIPTTKRLISNIANAKHVILADADLGVLTFDFINSIDIEAQIRFIENTYQPKRKITLHHSEQTIERKITQTLAAKNPDDNILITTNSKKQIISKWKDYCKQHDIEYVEITKDIKETAELLQMLENVSIKGKIVLASPSLSTGVDVQAIFTHVFGIFKNQLGQSFTAQDIDQQISRIRNASNVDIHINDKTYDRPTEPVVAVKNLSEQKTGEQLIVEIARWYFGVNISDPKTAKVAFVNSMMVDIFINKNSNNLKQSYIDHITNLSVDIEFVDPNDFVDEPFDVQVPTKRNTNGKLIKLANELKDDKSKDRKEYARYQVFTLATADELLKLDKTQLQNTGFGARSMPKYLEIRLLLREILDTTCLYNRKKNTVYKNNYVNDKHLTKFVKFIKSNRQRIHSVLWKCNADVDELLKRTPTSALRTFVKLAGLRLTKVKLSDVGIKPKHNSKEVHGYVLQRNPMFETLNKRLKKW